jgi:hypothetical protein
MAMVRGVQFLELMKVKLLCHPYTTAKKHNKINSMVLVFVEKYIQCSLEFQSLGANTSTIMELCMVHGNCFPAMCISCHRPTPSKSHHHN